MPIDTRMFEVDTSRTILADDNLQLIPRQCLISPPSNRCSAYLIVPPIRTGSNLHTALQVIRPAQKRPTQLTDRVFLPIRRIGCPIVQANHEERLVHDSQTASIILIAIELGAHLGPSLAVLGCEETDGGASYLCLGEVVRISYYGA